jgi:hypothetical protein
MQKHNRILLPIALISSVWIKCLESQTPPGDSTTIDGPASCHQNDTRFSPDEAAISLGFSKDSLANHALSIQCNFDVFTLPPLPCEYCNEYMRFRLWRAASASPLQRQADDLLPSWESPALRSWQLSATGWRRSTRPSPFLKWLGQGAFWWAAFFDHYQDAIPDAGGRKSYLFGADRRHWHFIKNLAHLGYLTTGFAAGMELGQKKVTVKRLALRMAGSVMIYWFIQNIVYDKSMYNVWFDYERKYTKDGVVIFDLHGRDHRIELSKWARPILDVVRVFGGMYLVIKN